LLSNVGWINGISSMSVLICGCIFGLFCLYKSKKIKAKLLFYLGLAAICAGLGQLGPSCDFLTILFTGKNMDNTYCLISILSFIWLPFCILFAMYLGAELLIPGKKKIIVFIYMVLGIVFELIIFLNPYDSFSFIYPETPGENLIDDSMDLLSPAGILTLVFALSGLLFIGFGFLYKTIQSTGTLRKKFLLLSTGMFLYIIFAALDGLTTPGIGLIIVRIPEITGFWFMYFGLKD